MNKATQNRILKTFEGSKKQKGIKDARKIAEIVGVPRRTVMEFLEDNKLATYSNGSYA